MQTTLFREQWQASIDWIDNSLQKISDEEMLLPISPSGNSAIWIFGHLIHAEDLLSVLLTGDSFQYPEYAPLFARGTFPKDASFYPPVEVLREAWKNVTDKSGKVVAGFSDAAWDEPHCLITNENRETDPFKTKGRCLTLWALHRTYHDGQFGVLISVLKKTKTIETLNEMSLIPRITV